MSLDNGADVNLKVVIGGGVAIFLIGSVFWAGATYNRLDSMEISLKTISAELSTQLSDMPILKMKVDAMGTRIDQLEQERDREQRKRY